MGVPSFYRWLVNKYPNVAVQARVPKDDEAPTVKFDNLYLDMNGIIHPCFHPDDQDPPTTFDQVFRNVFEYIDWLFRIVRPKKLLFMAIDGVAPRAKMNQQRSRRFRTAKDAEIADLEEEKIRKEFEKAGKKVLPKQESEVSDSNIITPGTEFMDKLSKALQNYIRSRLKNDPGWRNIKVILSDANSPGEGEHKIMKFIHIERTLPGYDPNTRHCLYGLDADLIMLALATHELHFSILREDVLTIENNPSCVQALQTSLAKYGNNSIVKSAEGTDTLRKADTMKKPYQKPYQFINIWTLREYLEVDLQIADSPVDIDFERILDDFIFICFFTGNDFLPHMPSLEIRERAVDLLMFVYRDGFKARGGYLVDTKNLERKKDYVDLKRVEKFILSVGAYEERIFKKRLDLRQLMVKRLLRKMSNDVDDLIIEEDSFIQAGPVGDLHLSSSKKSSVSNYDSTSHGTNLDDVLQNTKELQKQLKDIKRERTDIFKQGGLEKDKIRLGMHGWRERYYKEKFHAESPSEIEDIRAKIAERYVEGLCWVLQYYFFGVGSWSWFYPFHYAPFASDLKGLGKIEVSFSTGTPLKPYDQLMGVLPPKSVCALPKAYWNLITSDDSKLIDFYPTEFNVDVDGKRYLWQGIVKLPFVDEERLISETSKVEKDLTEEEVKRNSVSDEMIFEICASCESCSKNPLEEDVNCGTYEYPQICVHIPRLLANVNIPEKTITESDLEKQPLWHEYEGHRPASRSYVQDRYRKPVNDRNSAPDQFSAKEIYKGAGDGFSMGRGKSNYEMSYTTHPGSGKEFHTPNISRPPSFRSPEMGNCGLGRGRSNMGISYNKYSMQGQSSLGSPVVNGRGSREYWNQSDSSPGRGNWVSARGRGYFEPSHGSRGVGFVESSRNQTCNAYTSVHPVTVGKMHSLSVEHAWEGSNQRVSSHTPTPTNNAGNAWPGRCEGYRETSLNQTSSLYNSMHRANGGRTCTPSLRPAWAGTARQELVGSPRNQACTSNSSNQNQNQNTGSRESSESGWSVAGSHRSHRATNAGRGVCNPARTFSAKNSFGPLENAPTNDKWGRGSS